jgi:hypothetical protein
MKVKILKPVIHSSDHGSGKHLKKGEIHDLPEKVANDLIKEKLAQPVNGEKKDEGDKK